MENNVYFLWSNELCMYLKGMSSGLKENSKYFEWCFIVRDRSLFSWGMALKLERGGLK
jgi:hypothetical protein